MDGMFLRVDGRRVSESRLKVCFSEWMEGMFSKGDGRCVSQDWFKYSSIS